MVEILIEDIGSNALNFICSRVSKEAIFTACANSLFLRLLLLKSNEEVVEGVINSVSQGPFQIVATATETLDTADLRLRTCKTKDNANLHTVQSNTGSGC